MTRALFSQPEVLSLGQELADLTWAIDTHPDTHQEDGRWAEVGLVACTALDISGIEDELRRVYADDEDSAGRYLDGIKEITGYAAKITIDGDITSEALWLEGNTKPGDDLDDGPEPEDPYLLIETRRDGHRLIDCTVFAGVPFGIGHDERVVLTTTPTILDVLGGGDEAIIARLKLSPDEHDTMQKLARTVRAARAIVGMEAQDTPQ